MTEVYPFRFQLGRTISARDTFRDKSNWNMAELENLKPHFTLHHIYRAHAVNRFENITGIPAASTLQRMAESAGFDARYPPFKTLTPSSPFDAGANVHLNIRKYEIITYNAHTTRRRKTTTRHINAHCCDKCGIQRAGMLQSETFVTISPSAQRGIGKNIYWNRRNSPLTSGPLVRF